MKKIYEFLTNALEKNIDCALIIVIFAEGSSPRGAGAAMAVDKNKNCVGTIGGGAVEFRAFQVALDLIEQKKSSVEFFELNTGDITSLGMICGGRIRVNIQFIESCKENLTLYSKLKEFSYANENIWAVTEIKNNFSKTSIVNKTSVLYGEKPQFSLDNMLLSKSSAVFGEDFIFFVQPIALKGRVYVFGAGHVSRKLIPVLKYAGFECVVFDDSDRFLLKEDFPDALEIIKGDFENINEYINIQAEDCVVILTRGHENDYCVLKNVLKTEAYYIGMIGSRKKVEKTRERLFEDGFSQEDFKRVHSPIGLKINAETPEEIAISICAEMILERAVNRGV